MPKKLPERTKRRPSPKDPSVVLFVRVPESAKQKIDRIAGREGRSMSQIVTKLIQRA